MRYRVGVEAAAGVALADFDAVVTATLSDPRSWIGGHDLRLRRVSEPTPGGFTVLLATPATARDLCRAAGLDIVWRGRPYTSCRVGDTAVINAERYRTAVPGYGAPLATYQRYAINHEVGHVLGYGHEMCPKPGSLAPVMQQQTFSLQRCVANGWPFPSGRRYVGPPGQIEPPD